MTNVGFPLAAYISVAHERPATPEVVHVFQKLGRRLGSDGYPCPPASFRSCGLGIVMKHRLHNMVTMIVSHMNAE